MCPFMYSVTLTYTSFSFRVITYLTRANIIEPDYVEPVEQWLIHRGTSRAPPLMEKKENIITRDTTPPPPRFGKFTDLARPPLLGFSG